MKKNIINLLFVSSFFLTGCSETKKESMSKNTNQSNKTEENINSDIVHVPEIVAEIGARK